MTFLKKILQKLNDWYAPDLRALALMRIGTALVIIADLLIRLSDLNAMYTEKGIWPSELIKHSGWKEGYWTIHNLFDSISYLYFLFGLHLLLALSLLLGYKARLSAGLLLLLSISLDNRNLFILQAGDDLLRLTLLWGIFLPWSARFAIGNLTQKSKTVPLFAGLGYFLLLASVYLFSVFLKTGKDWHEDGTALYYALSLRQLRLPLGEIIYNYPGFLKFATTLVYYLEIIIPALILLPSKSGRLRTLAFFLTLFLQLSIGLTLYVGLFYIISITSALGLLSPNFLNRFSRKSETTITSYSPTKIIVECFSLCLLILCFFINLSSLKSFPLQLSNPLASIANALRLDQNWAMFSPDVLRKDGWLVYHGMDDIGRQWDLRLNEDYVVYDEPKHIVSMYKNDRWRKLAENMQDDRFTFLRPQYCSYVLREWNKHHPRKKMNLLQLYFVERQNLPNYKSTDPKRTLYSYCNER